MPDLTQLISGGVVVALITLILTYTRIPPGDRKRLEMEEEESDVTVESRRLDLARTRITLVDNYEDQLAKLATQLATVRDQLTQLQEQFEAVKRAHHTSEANLRVVTADRDRLAAENSDLRIRVEHLERRVSQVEGNGP